MPRVRLTTHRLMLLVAAVALVCGDIDQIRMARRAARYRDMADGIPRQVERCREIDAMDPVIRAREAFEAMDDLYLDHPDWNREMIPYLEELARILADAAEHPRRRLPPLPPQP